MLLLLGADDVHGYKLHQEIGARGLAIHGSSMYRQLQAFEHDGWVASHWTTSPGGRRRRHMYRRTEQGRAALHELSAVIAQARGTYDTFVHAYEQAVIRRATAAGGVGETGIHGAREDGARSRDAQTTAGPAPLSARGWQHGVLMAGWLLLTLELDATYGYDLRREVDAARGLTTDLGATYRMLRRFEAERWVRSRWTRSAAGPRRRVYRLTVRGRRNLDQIAELIAAIRDTHDAYLRAYRSDGGVRGP